MQYLIISILVLVFALTLPETYRQWKEDSAFKDKIEHSVEQMSSAGKIRANRAGIIRVDGEQGSLKESFIQEYLKKQQNRAGALTWNWGKTTQATISAMGIDGQHHFVNSYLLGYQPFETTQLWVPLYTLATRKQYEYDHLQYSGLKEVWQNSWQAYYYTRGDCEDHSIILADWLIEMGIDARVVLGKYKKEGHAWVVFFLKGKAYLLEATNKKKSRRTGDFPLASMMVNYHPQFQFNQDRFWVNQGSLLTTNYTGPMWKEKSRFVEKKRI